MSASDIRANKRFAGRTAIIYICISLFCGLFSAIYEHFSHEVYSDFMVYLFLYPLIGGALPYTVIGLTKRLKSPSPESARIYNSGLAALTLGSCIKGVLDIYGTSSVYVSVYWMAGVLLVATGSTIYLYQALFHKERSKY